MATTQLPPESPETQQQYAAQLAITEALIEALRQLWAITLPLDSQLGADRFQLGTQVLVQQSSGIAIATATDYYRTLRLDAGIQTTLPPRIVQPVEPAPISQIDAGLEDLMRQVEAEAERMAAELDKQVEAEHAEMLRVEAAMQKAAADAARRQLLAMVEGDEKALGFRRVPRPGACAFCIIQAIRSTTRKGFGVDFKKYVPNSFGGDRHYGVYKSRATAGANANKWFTGDGEAKFHNNCHCVIEPVFSPVEKLPDWLSDMEQLYDDTEGGINEFRRALKALRRGEEPEPPPIPALVTPKADPRITALLDLLTQQAA